MKTAQTTRRSIRSKPRRQISRAVGYLRVSTQEQGDSGLGLDAQRAKVEKEAADRGWTLCLVEDRGLSAKSLARPGLTEALRMVREGDADALIVSKVDRLSRSLHDFTGLLEESTRDGWSLVILDISVDTSTPQGELMAHQLASFSHFERRLISERTKDALRAARSRGTALGRPATMPDDIVARIVSEREKGASLRQIANRLNDDGIPTAQGGKQWHAATVSYTLKRIDPLVGGASFMASAL